MMRCSGSRSRAWSRTCSPICGQTACTRGFDTTTWSSCARRSARSRTRGASACRFRPRSRIAWSARASSPCTPTGQTGGSPSSPTATPASTATCSRRLVVAAPPGLPVRGHRRCARRAAAGRAASFPDGGYHVQRSGWGRASARSRTSFFLIFDCGPLGEGGHGHYDLLSVEVAAAGGPLLVDPGRFTYSEGPPNLRRWFKGTAAHNTVCVDGRDQTAYRRGKPKGPVARGRCSSDSAHPDSTSCAASPRARATTPSTSGRSRSWRASTG